MYELFVNKKQGTRSFSFYKSFNIKLQSYTCREGHLLVFINSEEFK